MKILIIRLSSIGDCVLASPVLAALRERYPQAEISWAVQSKSLPVVRGSGGLQSVVLWDDQRGRLRSLMAALRLTARHRFDVVVDLHGLDKAALFIAASRAARRITGSRSGALARRWSTEVVAEDDSLIHARLFYLRRAAPLDIAADSGARHYPLLPLTPQHQAFAESWLEQQGVTSGHRLFGLNLGASKPPNRWPPERFAQLAERLLTTDAEARVIVFGAPADAGLLQAFEATTAGYGVDITHRILPAVGQVNLLQVAALSQRCSAFVTADTGPMHIAAAAGAPVVALFGPADPRGTGPVGKPGAKAVRVLEARQVTGSWPAPMTALTVESVRQAVMEL